MARVGFIGLGAMGRPMAANVLRGGHDLAVYDINRAAIESLRAAGATVAAGYRDIAESSELVITMLPRPEDVEQVVFGPSGLLASGLRRGSTFVDMSTGDLATAKRLAATLDEHGIPAIDCPVGRTPIQAETGSLLLMAGGRQKAVGRARPVLMSMGDELVHCGGPGMGQAMKLVNNMLAIMVMGGVGEALAVGTAAGLPLELIRSVTAKTLAQTAVLDTALPAKAFAGDLSPGFALRLAEKDIRLATQLAEQLGVAAPVAAEIRQRCADLVADGHADHDVSVLAVAGIDQLSGSRPRAGRQPQGGGRP